MAGDDLGSHRECRAHGRCRTLTESANKRGYPPPKAAIAVLPFDSMSSEAGHQYFGDGVTEEILNALVRKNTIPVIARMSSSQFRDQNLNAIDVADELSVSHVVQGSVQKSGNQVRVTAQLIDGGSGVQLWSAAFDGELTNILTLQTDIAEQIVDQIRTELPGAYEQPQIYGTQFDEDDDGWPVPFPIEDPENVNERRLSLGLNTLEEHTRKCLIGRRYGVLRSQKRRSRVLNPTRFAYAYASLFNITTAPDTLVQIMYTRLAVSMLTPQVDIHKTNHSRGIQAWQTNRAR